MNFYVYIAYNEKNDKFYIGQTYNLNKRIIKHNLGLSNFTSKYKGEWKIVYNEQYENRADAMKREKFLKNQKNKHFYRKLIKGIKDD